MSQIIKYGNTILPGINKAGDLKPDADGYYTVVLGALGVDNSIGETYVDTPVSRATFAVGSVLQRRLARGLLRGEWGHPKASDSPSKAAFEYRIRQLDEDRICCHYKEIWLDTISHEGRKVLGILGKVRPSGPFGPALKDMLDNPHENVTFSGRYWSNLGHGSRGELTREIHTAGTWDFVTEPGIASAMKYNSPSLESMKVVDDSSFEITSTMIQRAIQHEKENHHEALSVESSGGLSATTFARHFEIKRSLPASLNW